MARSKRWVWYFLGLSGLSLCAVLIPIFFNLSLQLTPEKFAAAKAKWSAHGHVNYDLEYNIKVNDQKHPDHYVAVVRNGSLQAVTWEGKPLPTEDTNALTVPDLFTLIEKGMQKDQRPENRKNYAVAYFGKTTGYPVRYIRRIKGSSDRLEINAVLKPQ